MWGNLISLRPCSLSFFQTLPWDFAKIFNFHSLHYEGCIFSYRELDWLKWHSVISLKASVFVERIGYVAPSWMVSGSPVGGCFKTTSLWNVSFLLLLGCRRRGGISHNLGWYQTVYVDEADLEHLIFLPHLPNTNIVGMSHHVQPSGLLLIFPFLPFVSLPPFLPPFFPSFLSFCSFVCSVG